MELAIRAGEKALARNLAGLLLDSGCSIPPDPSHPDAYEIYQTTQLCVEFAMRGGEVWLDWLELVDSVLLRSGTRDVFHARCLFARALAQGSWPADLWQELFVRFCL
jgi:hypothetical protein